MNSEFLNEKNPVVEFDVTGFGKIQIEIFEDIAPITAKNFLNLVNEKFYDGLIFHRVIENFMIQGGDPLGNGTGGSEEEIIGEFEANGYKNPIKHERGAISMARTNKPNSASSQFFIMHKNAPHLDGAYAAFGMVVNGIEVVDKIAEVKTNYYDMPLKKVVIKSIRRIK